jgi:hypothetical protein
MEAIQPFLKMRELASKSGEFIELIREVEKQIK